MSAAPLTHGQLLAILDYDPEAGAFTWKVVPNGRITVGQKAGSPNSDGYIQIKIGRRLYGAHRLAWFYVYGSWPGREIDHRNCVKHDNRIENLREADRYQQTANVGISRANTSGFKGVSWNKKRRKWRACIYLDKKQRNIGFFDRPEDAHLAYCRAAIKKSGEFARVA